MLVALAAGIFYFIDSAQYRESPAYLAERYLEELERQYAEDTYGGATPEETLALFTAALEQGDPALAAKYFAVDRQQQWREKLADVAEQGALDDLAATLKKPAVKYPLIKGAEDRYMYEIFNDGKALVLQIDIAKGPGERWKLLDL